MILDINRLNFIWEVDAFILSKNSILNAKVINMQIDDIIPKILLEIFFQILQQNQ